MEVYTSSPPNEDIVTHLAAITAEHTTLEKLLSWCTEQKPPIRIAAMITQDEFTSDVIVPLADVYLVYDTT